MLLHQRSVPLAQYCVSAHRTVPRHPGGKSVGKAPPFLMHAVDFRKLVSNFTLLSGGEVLGKLLAFATFTYLARTLGPKSFGYLEFTIALMVFFTLLTDFGTSPFGARE